MSKLVTIFGGSGFIGRHVAQAMATRGWRVRVAVRRPNQAVFVRTYGVVGQVEPIQCNIRDDLSVRAAMAGSDAVVNCVGILVRSGKNTFDAVQDSGAGMIAEIAAETGVLNFVHVSAIGALTESKSAYASSKGRGEAAVLAARPDAVIVRPSVVFGEGDSFFAKFAGIARMSPVLPITGGRTRFQPVYVKDVAEAIAMGAEGRTAPGIYELGGPEILTLREIIDKMLHVIRRHRFVLNMPSPFAMMVGAGFDAMQTLSGGLFTNTQLTRDQVRQLREDNLVTSDVFTFADLGIVPTAFEAVIPDYLWPYRPGGQYASIKESAQQLRHP